MARPTRLARMRIGKWIWHVYWGRETIDDSHVGRPVWLVLVLVSLKRWRRRGMVTEPGP